MIAFPTGSGTGGRLVRSSRSALRLLDVLQTWHGRMRERRALLQLDDRMLKDVGLSRADVAHEAGKPFWMD